MRVGLNVHRSKRDTHDTRLYYKTVPVAGRIDRCVAGSAVRVPTRQQRWLPEPPAAPFVLDPK